MLNSSPSFKTIAIESNDFKIGSSTFKTELNNINPLSTQQINENTRDIIELSNKVSQNTINIATDISNLDNKVATNTSNIATNTSNIATNTSNIATNTSNIATNTSNIATNTSNIANLPNVYEPLSTTKVSIGEGAGVTNQGAKCIAIGYHAGEKNQTEFAVAVGIEAGNDSQQSLSIAIGKEAGKTSQDLNCIAIGANAGQTSQNLNSIAIGKEAGNTGQGTNCIAIGQNAGDTSQANNTIILNAQSSTPLNTTSSDSIYIKPIRNDTSSNFLYYNNTSGEITHSAPTTITTSALPTQINEIGYNTTTIIPEGTSIPLYSTIATLATIVLQPGVYHVYGFFNVEGLTTNYGTTTYITEGGTDLVINYTVVAINGFTTSYISKIINVSPSTTRTILFRASVNQNAPSARPTVDTGEFNVLRIA